ncbi:DUF2521 family protein [Alkalihalobacillus sp. LMS39]|uniref:DUF2521 family protein n=1 Tax=Alkalihalobacillus sp. LMS39 TaxID=2924032 RepID=UPI001FB36C9A|nr:DUF2521 family protein [Alkalihalobacillus sp. LMS39]UOE94289.1 YbaK family protein [Alkalihalobacillus sp. LMS39]
MTVITTFSEKQREKRWKFERKVLRQLSLTELRENVKQQFQPLFPLEFMNHPYLLDPCIDTAIDAYLLGAEYSRFGYHGEDVTEVKARCKEELDEVQIQIFELLESWFLYDGIRMESLAICVDVFIQTWWERGFFEGQKRYRLRLH